MAEDTKRPRAGVQERDLPAADPLAAAFDEERTCAPLAIRPVERGGADPATGPRYPRASTALARPEPRADLAARDGARAEDEGCCCECTEDGQDPFGDSPGGHVARTPGWDDGSRGWDRNCVERARARLGLRGIPDAVTARLGRVLGPTQGAGRNLPAAGTEPQLAGRRASPSQTGRPPGALPPRTTGEPDDA
jgi:hypothetical protein